MVVTGEGISEELEHDIPQHKLWQILFMFSWPAVWFSFLIYIVGRQFIPEGGVTPTWVMLAVTVLGTGAELVVGLLLLRREGYALTIAALRDRIRWKWPQGWQAWLIAVAVLTALVFTFFPTGAFIDDSVETPFYIVPRADATP